ncbi:hypothetical protein WJX72_012336 [[Myrmecia] bisecta]|uniref:Protein kinase domain-containing protein n=1 Tax=[Myrmecia] bisecta TaxID=41462 RepID=A0AAW1RBE6_9CHLO
MAHGYSSPDEESVLGKAEIYAEIYGTPPSRLQGNKPHKRQPAGSQRKLKPAGRKDKQARQQGCAAKQKARLDARAFKELDTTLQVLGIDGATPQNAQRVTASTHAPLVAQESPRLHRSGSSRGEFYLERSGSDQQLSDSGRRHSGPSRHHSMSSPCPSAPPSVPTSPKRAISQPAPTPGYRRSPSTDVLGRPETRKLVRLESERQEWHAVLDNLLNGNFAREDLDLAVSIARSKAEDLKEQLIWWQTPPEASWPAREERLNWLELALQEAKDISAGLKRHGVVVEEEGHITYLHDCLQIIRDALREVRGLVGICCDAIAEGMRSLGGTVDETKRGFRAVHRVVSISQKLASNLKTATWTQLQPLEGPQAEAAQHSPDAELLQLSRDLGGSAFEVVVAALEATGNLQESVLCDKALLPGLGASSSAHEVSVQAKLLQSSWQACGELVDMIMQGWPALRLDITREWCKLFLRAAQLADGMQHKARMTQRSSSLASLDAGAESDGTGGPCTSGVWGNYCGSPVTQPATNGAVGDDDLQAQAWLPAMLSSLLTQAEKSANAIARQLSYPVAEEAGADGKQPAASEVDERIEALLDELSDAFYDLAYTGTHRVARMCRAPEPLACWALELLEEQACQAVVFVRDLDKSLLGQGEHALHHYETLRRCTDTLVNAILRVRRLLKQRRSDSECNQDPPRPIPRNDSHISLGQSSAVSSPLSSRPATPPMAIPSANSPAASTDGRANQTAALPPAHPVGPRPDPPAWGSFKPLKTGRGAAPEGRPHSPALFPAGAQAAIRPGRAWKDVLQFGGPSSEANSVAEDVNNGVVSSNGCELSTSPLKAKLNLPWENDPFWQVKWEDLKPTLIKKLGSGSFGQVYEAYYHSAPMAVKILTIDVNSGIEGLNRTLRRFKDEVDLQRRLSLHPNIVRFLGAACQIPISLDSLRSPTYAAQGFMQGMTLAIIMELCRFGNLFKLIEVARRVARLPPSVRSAQQPPRSAEEAKLKASPGWKLFSSWPIRLELARQAAAAVEFLHSHGVVHRDLTSYNLLVTDKWEAKVCDFNLARAVRETEMVAHSGSINSPEWSAPERLAGQAYGRSADVFSFGVVVWELITLGVPWHEDDDDEGSSSSESGGQFRDPFFFVMQSVPRGSRLVFPAPDAVCPSLPELPQVIALVQECWAQKPCERPTMALVCKRLECILGAVRGRLREEHRRRLP